MKDDLDLAFNVKFVNTVAQYSILYDYTDHNYSNRDIQERAWKEVGRDMNESGPACKEKWKNIRSAYTRHLRERLPISCTTGTKKKQYYLAKYLDFLYPFTKTRKRRSYILPPETITVDTNNETGEDSNTTHSYLEEKEENITEENIKDEEEDIEQHTIPTNSTTQNTNSYLEENDEIIIVENINEDEEKIEEQSLLSSMSTEIPNKKRKLSDPLGNVVVDYNTSNNKDNKINAEDPDLQFFKSILPDLHKMNSYQKYQFKLRTMQTIGDLLYKQ